MLMPNISDLITDKTLLDENFIKDRNEYIETMMRREPKNWPKIILQNFIEDLQKLDDKTTSTYEIRLHYIYEHSFILEMMELGIGFRYGDYIGRDKEEK